MATPGYTGPVLNYFVGAGAVPTGMPAGSNNQNAFPAGTVAQYLTSTSMSRRGVALYSNVSATLGSTFAVRLTVAGATLAPARIGPQVALFPNRNGFNTATITTPY